MAQDEVLYHLLKNRPHIIGCEVGVYTGLTTQYLLKKLPNIEKYYAVDPWKIYEMYNGNMYRKPGHKKYKTMKEAKKQFDNVVKPFLNKMVIYHMTSIEAVKLVDDNSLDWVFIDANHEYEYIKENLTLWSKKVKIDGLVSGHDYGNKWKGIKRAVNEFVPKEHLLISPNFVWSYVKGKF